MQAQDDIVKAILSSLPTAGSGDQDGLPSFEQAIFQAENFIRAVRSNFHPRMQIERTIDSFVL